MATLSRSLSGMDETSVHQVCALNRQQVLARLRALKPARLTMDFDGSVLSTSKFAEGTVVGFNKKKKGARSYYPLHCTLAQTGQAFDVYHRSGNVHDSNGAKEFILACIQAIGAELPGVIIELRMDSAFFNDKLVDMLDKKLLALGINPPGRIFRACRFEKDIFYIRLLSALPAGLSNKRFRLWFASLTQSNLIRLQRVN